MRRSAVAGGAAVLRSRRRRAEHVQAAVLQCLLAYSSSDATRLAYLYDRSKRVKNARSAGKLLRERVLQAKKTEVCAQNRT